MTNMKFIKRTLALALLALALTTPQLKAADYAVQKTFWSFAGTWTNSPTIVTNLNAAIDVTQFTDFALLVKAAGTNNSVGAGSFDIVWETSLDGVNWPGTTNQIGRTIGWFSAPYQSNSFNSVWVTNITVDAIGYWRIRHVTNQCNMNFTNLTIAGYVKPKRTARDQ
jgi:hypothetical protein